jgi:hypothetical protein
LFCCLAVAEASSLPFLPHTQDWDSLAGRLFMKKDAAYHCRHCDFTTAKKPNIVSHVQVRHLDGFEGYACAYCTVVSSSYRGFEQHVPKHGIVLSKYQLLANIQPTTDFPI